MANILDTPLFNYVASAYASMPDGSLANNSLYRTVTRMAGIPDEVLEQRDAVGERGELHNLVKRKIRWHQQTLKHLGLLEKAERGTWQLTKAGKDQLRRIESHVAVLGYSTDLGICVWGAAERVFERLDRPITLCVTSIPYLLRKPRAYGNVQGEIEYVDFVCRIIEPVVRHLAPGGSICLNISNDIFEPGSPARSMYIERLLISLHDCLGLQLMDRLIWESNKAPAPLQWASLSRQQLQVGYEPVYWFTNDPHRVRSDNRRVLQEHTDRHLALIRKGGEQRDASYCDGAYTLRKGKSFANETSGRIPRNVLHGFEAPVDEPSNLLYFANTCASKRRASKQAKNIGLPTHGATMPLALARFLVQFLTGGGEDELVADICSGWNTTGLAAEELGVPWIASEIMWEYVRGGAERFRGFPGFSLDKEFAAVCEWL